MIRVRTSKAELHLYRYHALTPDIRGTKPEAWNKANTPAVVGCRGMKRLRWSPKIAHPMVFCMRGRSLARFLGIGEDVAGDLLSRLR